MHVSNPQKGDDIWYQRGMGMNPIIFVSPNSSAGLGFDLGLGWTTSRIKRKPNYDSVSVAMCEQELEKGRVANNELISHL